MFALYRNWILIGGFVIACGCNGSSPDTACTTCSPQEIPFEELGAEMTKSYCQQVFSCCTSEEIRTIFGDKPILYPPNPAPKDEEACINRSLLAFADEISAGHKDSVHEGRIVFDPNKAFECFERIKDQCLPMLGDVMADAHSWWSKWQKAEPLCSAMLEGQVKDKDVCTIDDDCAEDTSKCDVSAGSAAGTCTPLHTEGEVCKESRRCREGLACLYTGVGSRCLPPFMGYDGQPCYQDAQCASRMCIESLCFRPFSRVEGEPCGSDIECESQLCYLVERTCAKNMCLIGEDCPYGNCYGSECYAFPPAGPICDGI